MLWLGQARWAFLSLILLGTVASTARGQTFGIELHNNIMPASGGMAGTSLSQPQDLQSAMNGNPATLRQFQGTQFSFGGAWADANYSITQAVPLPLVGVTPYSASSGTPGSLMGNIGVTQDLDAFGIPATMGLGFITNAGVGSEFRQIPASNGTSSQYLALDMEAALGFNVTERLAFGATGTVGTSFLDGPFVDLAGMTGAYGFRGTVGANYCVNANTSLGAYWQSKKSFEFENAAIIGGIPLSINFDHPANFGFGFANSGLMCGRLLLAADVIYNMNADADFLKAIYQDQFCFQLGSQYKVNERVRLRTGYAYNENPMKDAQAISIGGVTLPDGIPALRYVQGQFASITQHRVTMGLGIRDFKPGIDLDLFAGFAFDATDQFATTTTDVDGNFWVGFGQTWRFGGCADKCSTAMSPQSN